MTKERLSEIKDSINFQKEITNYKGFDFDLLQEEIDLYDEVIRLQQNQENLIKYIEDELNLIENVYLLEETDEDVRKHLLTKEDIFEDLLERIKNNNYES